MLKLVDIKYISFENDNPFWGGTQSWTGDLLICSQMLYRWAIPPVWEEWACLTLKVMYNFALNNMVDYDSPLLSLKDLILQYIYMALKTLFWSTCIEIPFLMIIGRLWLNNTWGSRLKETSCFQSWYSVIRGHPELNWGPLDLQSNALPLSYTPCSL